MLPLLRAVCRPLLPPGENLSRVRHEVLKYEPGKRSVIAYELYAGAALPCARVIGKLYRNDRGRAMYDNLLNLWQASERPAAQRKLTAERAAAAENGLAFAMPQPLAYLSDLGMVLQRAAPGRLLAGVTDGEELFLAMQHVAKNLAALHGLPLPHLARKSLEDHLQKYCHPGPQALVEALPEYGPLVNAGLRLMAEGGLAETPVCPVHGDLNLAQIFITADRAYFIDFDGMCLAHAALDAGNFLATLKVHFGAKAEELRHVFLETYLAHAPLALEGLRTYQAFAYFRRALIHFRRQTEADWRTKMEHGLKTSLALLQEAAA